MKVSTKAMLGLALAALLAGGGECVGVNGGTAAREFIASFSGDAERPDPVDTDGTGFGTFTLNESETALAYDIAVSGLSGDVEAAHFHYSATGPAGFGPFILPGGTDGTITQNVVNDGSGGATASGTLAVNSTDVANLRLGYLYVNFHTAMHPPGEVRGNIVPAP